MNTYFYTIEDFISALDDYWHCYNEELIKKTQLFKIERLSAKVAIDCLVQIFVAPYKKTPDKN